MLVYRYGLLPPTHGADRVDEQIRLAHRYRNLLVEIERGRRDAVAEVLSSHADVAPLRAAVDATEGAMLDLLGQAKAYRARERKRKLPEELGEALGTARATLKEARQRYRDAKRALREDAGVVAALRGIEERATLLRKAARATCGVFWGTYLTIEAAVDASRHHPAPPRFSRWTGDGAVAVQIQGGLAVEDATAGHDRRFAIDTRLMAIPGRGGKPRPRIRLRVGSEGRAPVWAEWPLVYHRPLPPAAKIMWAKVVRERVCDKDRWSLHVTLDDVVQRERCGEGVVAVDLRWSLTTRGLRACQWLGDDDAGAEAMLDPRVLGQFAKAEDLRSIRDKAMNEARVRLVGWTLGADLTPEWRERARFVSQWRSPVRLAALALWWREHRQPSDDEAYAALEEWRKQDKHLWLWETGARRRGIARRRDQYRVLAAQLARRYGVLVIERLNLATLARIPEIDSERDDVPQGRSQRVEAAPSELRSALVQAFASRGGRIMTVPATGPVGEVLAAYHSSTEVRDETPGAARVGKFHRKRASGAARAGDGDENGEALENGPES